MNRDVVHVHADIFRAQRLEHLPAIGGQLAEIEPDWIEMPGRIHVVAHGGETMPRSRAK